MRNRQRFPRIYSGVQSKYFNVEQYSRAERSSDTPTDIHMHDVVKSEHHGDLESLPRNPLQALQALRSHWLVNESRAVVIPTRPEANRASVLPHHFLPGALRQPS